MNQFRPVTMIAGTTPETHNPRISAQTVTHRLREIGERPPYTMHVLYPPFLFWPSIYKPCISSSLKSLTNILAEDNLGVLFNTGVCNKRCSF